MNTPLRIGELELAHPFILAPLEGVSDCAFRRLCYQLGAAFTWTEMVRASGIVRGNSSTEDLIDTFDPETPTGLQLFCTNERELEEALVIIEQQSGTSHPHWRNIRAIDLNFGCPSPEIIRIGAGPALIKRSAKMRAILSVLHAWKASTSIDIKAVGLKIRLGLNEREAGFGIALRVLDSAEGLADYLVVHARHARQRSTDPADWGAIATMKEKAAKANIPLIGNGDALTADAATRMIKETGCDGVLIARGAIANPWIFRKLSGIGAEIATKEEIEAALLQYRTDAKRFNAKPKYISFHEQNFARLLAGKLDPRLPRTEHLQ